MIRRMGRSLRTRLALTGFVFALVPMTALLSVVFVTEERVETDSGPGGQTIERVVSASSSGVSMWVPLTAALLLFPAAIAAWWWPGRATRPLADMATLADEIQEGSLRRRIHLTGAADEVQALGDSFDRMLDRLADASANQRRLIEDTSHELRTPLAALAATTEVMLAVPAPTLDGYRAATVRAARQTARLRHTIETLLSDTRAREGVTGQSDNDLMVIVRQIVGQQRLITPELAIRVDGPDSLLLGIDGPSVERAITALIENAARHSPPDRCVDVDIVIEDDVVHLSVTDAGDGVEPMGSDRIFDRYYRGQDASQNSARSGIGLAIAKQVADAYGGICVTSPLGLDGGTRFTMTFATTTSPRGT